MSRRKTVKVAQLEGKADAFREARGAITYVFTHNADRSERAILTAIREALWDREVEALRDMTKAQRAQEDEA